MKPEYKIERRNDKTLTLDEHREIADHMRQIRAHTMAIGKLLSGRVRVGALDGLHKRGGLSPEVAKLRDELDAVVHRLDIDNPASVYYG